MLEVTDLKKKFGKREALKGVSFSLAAGEIYGLLGPNGAGKTTTLKILAGLLAADGGRVIVSGQPYHREQHELKKLIAYVPDQPFLYYKLSGEEHLNFYLDLYKFPYARRR
jgi:ABC-2 type transport system ATP-binding protein